SKKKFFAAHRTVRQADGAFTLEPAPQGKGFFTSYEHDGRFITYYGDNHPLYAGNVVKAMASARDGYPQVLALFADEIAAQDPQEQDERDREWKRLTERLDAELIARVAKVNRLTPNIVEAVIHAPAAARRFEPGQFYRLQNFETQAERICGTR